MDLAASCKDKLAFFRIKELKDVLTQLGLAKQGKKQDLVDRILALFSDEGIHAMMNVGLVFYPKSEKMVAEKIENIQINLRGTYGKENNLLKQ